MLLRQLKERVKELDCIYAICHVVSDPGIPCDRKLQDITDRIPAAFQKPEFTCARIIIGDKVAKTANFKTCHWKLETDITKNEMIHGKLEVGYLDVQPYDRSPFLEEEKKLLSIIALRLGMYIEGTILTESLRKSEKQYRNLVENAPVGICQTTLGGDLLYANNTCLRMFGYEENFEEAKSVNFLSRYPNPVVRKTMTDILLRTGSLINYEAECLTKTGTSIFILFSSFLDADEVVTTMMMDISEQRRISTRLIRSERRLAEAQRIAHLGNWEWDIINKRMDWSDEMIEIFGVHPRKINATCKEFLQLVHPDDRAAVREAVEQQMASPGESCSIMEHRLIRADGGERIVQLKSEVIFDKNKPVRMFGTVHDITAQKQSERALRKAFEEITTLKDKLEAENIYLRDKLEVESNQGDIIGTSDPIKYVLYRSRKVARTKATILLTGDTGTGKNLFASFIHLESDRRDKPFITVNCAGLPVNLIESELFGREKGAFTGSTARQIGRFELADKGTIFLDEIGELPIDLQAKLLKVIDEGEFERLGSPHTIKVNVRIIASTNRNLEEEIQNGRFRRDLFFRLNVFPINIPPLRERKGDIPAIVAFYAHKFSREYRKNIKKIPTESMNAFVDYSWPGNVRELINIVERAVIVSEGPELRLAEPIGNLFAEPLPDIQNAEGLNKGHAMGLAEVEKEYIQESLRKAKWKIEGPGGAAELLGMNPSTVRGRMRKLGIRRPEAPRSL